MTWYKGTYKCGHEGTVQYNDIKRDVRERKASNHFEVHKCETCQRVDLERARQIAKKLNLPDLSGTPEQVNRALVIRQNFLDQLSEYQFEGLTQKDVDKIGFYIAYTRTSAQYYVPNWNNFRTLIERNMNILKWSNESIKKEILLVRQMQKQQRKREPEQVRWIKSHNDCLLITWKGYNQLLFKKAIKLPGAKYEGFKNGLCLIRVPLKYHNEISQFATANKFSFTPEALELLKETVSD